MEISSCNCWVSGSTGNTLVIGRINFLLCINGWSTSRYETYQGFLSSSHVLSLSCPVYGPFPCGPESAAEWRGTNSLHARSKDSGPCSCFRKRKPRVAEILRAREEWTLVRQVVFRPSAVPPVTDRRMSIGHARALCFSPSRALVFNCERSPGRLAERRSRWFWEVVLPHRLHTISELSKTFTTYLFVSFPSGLSFLCPEQGRG